MQAEMTSRGKNPRGTLALIKTATRPAAKMIAVRNDLCLRKDPILNYS